MLTSKNICIAFGSVFVLVGFLGFIPNPIVSAEGLFETNVMHNLVHVLTGSAFLFGGLAMEGREGFALNVITGVVIEEAASHPGKRARIPSPIVSGIRGSMRDV
ncbi:hypothetical protein [Nitrospira moscoviensis]|uniref:DUF4383 domain-containing protein n=1 Tax=Nitrospira moscoviensis TaxID=42253 RepID=A0A0K2GAX2_NITMO|nr:hypothetical protein [Nitrospira moscoviensis]ALA58095.1 exported protein of unknown function [Nitrospira moscoviensis]